MDEDLKRIASRIRSWRGEAGFTLQKLGERSGVSASTIHKIENLQTVPTIAVLLKVAHGLSRRPSELLAEVDVSDQIAVLRRDDRQTFDIKGRGKLEHLIGMIPRNRIDLWRAVLEPGLGAGADGDPWQFPGEVVVQCESGLVDCEVSGKSFQLGPGDTIHFDTAMPHRWVAGGGEPATVMVYALLPERLQGDLVTRLAEAVNGGPVGDGPVCDDGEREVEG